MDRTKRSQALYDHVYAAVLRDLKVPMRRSGEAEVIARAAANAAVQEDDFRAQERLDVMRINEEAARRV